MGSAACASRTSVTAGHGPSRRPSLLVQAQANQSSGQGPFNDPNVLAGMFMAYAMQLQQQQDSEGGAPRGED